MALREQLLESLRTVGMSPATLTSSGGQSVIVLPYGGRILGLFSSASAKNVLWSHPALEYIQTASELYRSERWHNSGGDRTWLAPELDFFFPEYPDTTKYVQPKPLDSGRFRVAASESELTLSTEFVLRSHRLGIDLSIGLAKSVSLLPDPLRELRDVEPPGKLEYAGYQLRTSLDLQNPHPQQAWVGIWNLLQMPGGGELLAPTYHRTIPTVFFGDIPQGFLQVEDRLVRFRMAAPGEQKISISALATTGRLGYVYADGNQLVLIVRAFAVNPSGAYRDVWFTHPHDDGFAVQACNINTESLGRFAEMEYHAPAIGGDSGQSHMEDVSLVWTYRGDHEVIRWAAEFFLGVEIQT